MKRSKPPGRQGPTISLSLLVPFMRLLESAGPEVHTAALDRGQQILARWGLSRNELEADVRARLPHDLMIELLLDFVDVLGDPSAPLRAGMQLREGDYELLEYLCSSCATLGESIRCLSRYYKLLGGAELELVVQGDRAEARFNLAPGLRAPDALFEFGLASNFAMAAMHVRLEGVQMPLEVCFAHAAPAHAAMFESIFFVPVRFGCEYNANVFPVSMLDHPMRKPDPLLHSVLTRLADHELDALIEESVFPAKVREAIEPELADGAPLETIASRLHMSASTLRSRLRQYGTSYSELLDDVRRDQAKLALRKSQLSISEVAHRLGFAHPPAFHRAVRRWFGATPSAYRAERSQHPVARFWRKP